METPVTRRKSHLSLAQQRKRRAWFLQIYHELIQGGLKSRAKVLCTPRWMHRPGSLWVCEEEGAAPMY